MLRTFVKRHFPRAIYLRNYLRSGWLRSAKYQDVFSKVYEQNLWGDDQSRSGPGSTLERTAHLREHLPILCRKYNVQSFLDIPCGDFHWMRHVDLAVEKYIGADLVEDLIRRNNDQYANERRQFLQLDLIADPLPTVDLIFCRDCLVHLTDSLIFRAIDNIRKSGSKYLLATTYIHLEENLDIVTGQWRPLNLQRRPFNFPEPVDLIDEHSPVESEVRRGKRAGLWRIDSI